MDNNKVAIVSPSSTLAGVFPWVFEQGLMRITTLFGLEPIIMPNCLNITATQKDKAADLHTAFLDKNIKAIISTTGGIDQIQLINELDSEIICAHPKPFFGYSDNTNLSNFLYNNGIKSFYGGSVLSQFAMQGNMCPETIDSLNWALFRSDEWLEIKAPKYCIDEDWNWENRELLTQERKKDSNDEGLIFINHLSAEGVLWGGCLESLADILRCYNRVPKDFSSIILFLETSEEIPSHEFTRRFMISIGESGILSSIKGLLVGRPKTWSFTNTMNHAERKLYRKTQMEIIASVAQSYNNQIPIILNLPIGHTDPQLILPYGGTASIEGTKKQLYVKH